MSKKRFNHKPLVVTETNSDGVPVSFAELSDDKPLEYFIVLGGLLAAFATRGIEDEQIEKLKALARRIVS